MCTPGADNRPTERECAASLAYKLSARLRFNTSPDVGRSVGRCWPGPQMPDRVSDAAAPMQCMRSASTSRVPHQHANTRVCVCVNVCGRMCALLRREGDGVSGMPRRRRRRWRCRHGATGCEPLSVSAAEIDAGPAGAGGRLETLEFQKYNLYGARESVE